MKRGKADSAERKLNFVTVFLMTALKSRLYIYVLIFIEHFKNNPQSSHWST